MKRKVVDSVISINASLDTSFFTSWFKFLEPIHHLTSGEIDVLACFAKHRFELSKIIKDDKVLDKYLFSEEYKRQIREELGLSLNHFQVKLSKLKQKGVIQDNIINPKLLPKLVEDAEDYRLMLLFNLK